MPVRLRPLRPSAHHRHRSSCVAPSGTVPASNPCRAAFDSLAACVFASPCAVVRDRFGPPCGVTAAGASLAFRHGNVFWVWLSSRARSSGLRSRRCNPCHPDACGRSSAARALKTRWSSFARNRAVDRRLPTANRRDAGSNPVACMHLADVAQWQSIHPGRSSSPERRAADKGLSIVPRFESGHLHRSSRASRVRRAQPRSRSRADA